MKMPLHYRAEQYHIKSLALQTNAISLLCGRVIHFLMEKKRSFRYVYALPTVFNCI